MKTCVFMPRPSDNSLLDLNEVGSLAGAKAYAHSASANITNNAVLMNCLPPETQPLTII